MFWIFSNYHPKYPHQKKIWIKIRFLHETDKAILVYCNGKKIWIAKSQVFRVKLKKDIFKIYVKESSSK